MKRTKKPSTKTAQARLRKLAAFIGNLKPRQLDLSVPIREADKDGCGTVCCAIGWTPAVFPSLIRWSDPRLNRMFGWHKVATELFGIELADHRLRFVSKSDGDTVPDLGVLFTGNGYGGNDRPAPKRVAAMLNHYATLL